MSWEREARGIVGGRRDKAYVAQIVCVGKKGGQLDETNIQGSGVVRIFYFKLEESQIDFQKVRDFVQVGSKSDELSQRGLRELDIGQEDEAGKGIPIFADC
jgi:hypothetical protein